MHEITRLQGLSLAALVFFLGIDFWLEALFLFRPIIVCTLTGAILGDIQTGLITGGLTELAFAGLTPAGGVQPPNPIMAGLMTTVIAWSTGVDAKTAIGLGLPFSLLMQYVILFFYSAFSLFMTKADKCAKEADTAAFSRLNWTTMLIVASAYAVIAFLCTYLAQGAMQALVKAMPAWLTHGFEVAGGILPAVGFGLLLRVMFKAQYIPYLIAGFLFVCYIQVSNLLPVAVLGAGFAVYESNNMDFENTTRVTSKKTTTEFICGHPNWCHRVMEWQTPVHLQDLGGSGKYIGASAVQGRKVYGIKVSKPKTLYIKRIEA